MSFYPAPNASMCFYIVENPHAHSSYVFDRHLEVDGLKLEVFTYTSDMQTKKCVVFYKHEVGYIELTSASPSSIYTGFASVEQWTRQKLRSARTRANELKQEHENQVILMAQVLELLNPK